METLTDKLRDVLLEDGIYNNIMKDAAKKILERTDVLRDVLLADDIFNIMKDAVKEILDKTEENGSVIMTYDDAGVTKKNNLQKM